MSLFFEDQAIAAAVLVMSVSGAFAATYGSINSDSKVREVVVLGSPASDLGRGRRLRRSSTTPTRTASWFRIDPPGPNNAGWVKKSAVDLDELDVNAATRA